MKSISFQIREGSDLLDDPNLRVKCYDIANFRMTTGRTCYSSLMNVHLMMSF